MTDDGLANKAVVVVTGAASGIISMAFEGLIPGAMYPIALLPRATGGADGGRLRDRRRSCRGVPIDSTALADFLCSEVACFITGCDILVDGGCTSVNKGLAN